MVNIDLMRTEQSSYTSDTFHKLKCRHIHSLFPLLKLLLFAYLGQYTTPFIFIAISSSPSKLIHLCSLTLLAETTTGQIQVRLSFLLLIICFLSHFFFITGFFKCPNKVTFCQGTTLPVSIDQLSLL